VAVDVDLAVVLGFDGGGDLDMDAATLTLRSSWPTRRVFVARCSGELSKPDDLKAAVRSIVSWWDARSSKLVV